MQIILILIDTLSIVVPALWPRHPKHCPCAVKFPQVRRRSYEDRDVARVGCSLCLDLESTRVSFCYVLSFIIVLTILSLKFWFINMYYYFTRVQWGCNPRRRNVITRTQTLRAGAVLSIFVSKCAYWCRFN